MGVCGGVVVVAQCLTMKLKRASDSRLGCVSLRRAEMTGLWTRSRQGQGVVFLVEYFPTMHEALGLV